MATRRNRILQVNIFKVFFSNYFPNSFRLKIYMVTNLDKTKKKKEEIYRFNESSINQIHPAKHITCSTRKSLKPTRLLVVPKIGTKTCWNACGLSNFIQPPR